MNKNGRVYLPGLNGIRTIASLAVLISHINLALSRKFEIKNFSLFGFINEKNNAWNLGEHGVTMFFVLSGFLITFLLIKEKNKTNRINVPNFYIRRILRIWPLYFFYFSVVLVTLLFLYKEPLDFLNTTFYLFLLANIPFIFGKALPAADHLWSIAVEEQFYLFWPTFFKLKESTLQKLLIIAIPLIVVIRILLWVFMPFHSLTTIFTVNRFDCMMFGGLLAIAVTHKNWLFKIISLKIIKLGAWFIFLISFLNYEILNSIVQLELITVATGIIICEQISNRKPIINLENRVFNFLGKYSYGIYVYHPLLILIFAKANLFSSINNESVRSILILLTILIFTITVAYFSFNLFEKYFINLKSKFSIIHSTNEKIIN